MSLVFISHFRCCHDKQLTHTNIACTYLKIRNLFVFHDMWRSLLNQYGTLFVVSNKMGEIRMIKVQEWLSVVYT